MATEAALAGGPVERRVEQRDLRRVHREDGGEVEQDEHGGRDPQEAVHVEDVLDAEGPRQRPHPGGEDGGADQAGQGQQPGDVRELVPQRQGAGGGQAHRHRHGEDGAEDGQPSRTHNTLSHGRGP